MKKIALNLILILSMAMSMSCANFGKKMKSFVSGKSSAAQAQKRPLSFSNKQSVQMGPRRQYKRTTKKTLEDTARVDGKSGSLWVMEGQGAYLFAQNIVRMIGDSLMVSLDGEPRQQLETKVEVITSLLKKLEKRRRLASSPVKKVEKSKKSVKSNKAQSAAKSGEKGTEEDEFKDSQLKIKKVPTRIVERLIDGNYRVKGSQAFMIGKREYKVIITGIIRSEDFNEDGISATRLMDPSFDIVSVRKSGS